MAGDTKATQYIRWSWYHEMVPSLQHNQHFLQISRSYFSFFIVENLDFFITFIA